MINEYDRASTRIIDRAKRVPLELKKIVKPLDVPMFFSTQKGELSFHVAELGMNDAMWLTKGTEKAHYYDFHQALIVKKNRQPMIALCTGVVEDDPQHSPVAVIFNLTEPDSRQVLIPTRGNFYPLDNDHADSGGLGISRLLRGNPRREMVKISVNSNALHIEVPAHVNGL